MQAQTQRSPDVCLSLVGVKQQISKHVYVYIKTRIYIYMRYPPPPTRNPRLGAVNQYCNIIKVNGRPDHCSWEGSFTFAYFCDVKAYVSAK